MATVDVKDTAKRELRAYVGHTDAIYSWRKTDFWKSIYR